jgi:hypothetical protein
VSTLGTVPPVIYPNGVRPWGPESEPTHSSARRALTSLNGVRPWGPESGLRKNWACEQGGYRLVRVLPTGRDDAGVGEVA